MLTRPSWCPELAFVYRSTMRPVVSTLDHQGDREPEDGYGALILFGSSMRVVRESRKVDHMR